MPVFFTPLLDHPAVRALLAESAGIECHLVGGVLRDFALGLGVHDVDAVVSTGGRELALRLAQRIPARFVPLGGKEFGAYRLVFGDDGLDLWDREGTPLYDDLARRDFTVNAVAWDPRRDEVVDPFGGLADIERRLLRATTEESFTDDPLRLLRLPRLLLRLPGFAADPATVELGRLSASLLPDVAAERIRTEVAQIFDHPEARRGLETLAAIDLYPGLWLGRPGEPGDAGPAPPLLEALAGAAAVLEEEAAPKLLGSGWRDGLRAARLAASFLPLPSSADAARVWGEAGYLSRKEAETITRLLAEEAIPEGEVELRRFLFRTGEALWAPALVLLGARAEIAGEESRWRAAAEAVLALLGRHGRELFAPPRLLSGLEVQEITGLPPGKALGQVMAALTALQVDGCISSREEAVRWLEERR